MTGEAVWESVFVTPAHWLRSFALSLRRTVLASAEHDVLTVAQATAYSAMVALFPALIVAAASMLLLRDEVDPKSSVVALTLQPLLTVAVADVDVLAVKPPVGQATPALSS